MAYDHDVWNPTRRITQNIRSAQSNDTIITDILEVNAIGVDGSDEDRGKLTHTKFMPQASHPSFTDPSIYAFQDSNGNQQFYQRTTRNSTIEQNALTFNINAGTTTTPRPNTTETTVNTNYNTRIVYGSVNVAVNIGVNRGLIRVAIMSAENFLKGNIYLNLPEERIDDDIVARIVISNNQIYFLIINNTSVAVNVTYRYFLEFLNP